MSIFVVKMLTILGFIFYAGGPVDALQLAFMGAAEMDELRVTCETCERTAALDGAPVQTASLLRSSIDVIGGTQQSGSSLGERQ